MKMEVCQLMIVINLVTKYLGVMTDPEPNLRKHLGHVKRQLLRHLQNCPRMLAGRKTFGDCFSRSEAIHSALRITCAGEGA